jgi:hypothetical protein
LPKLHSPARSELTTYPQRVNAVKCVSLNSSRRRSIGFEGAPMIKLEDIRSLTDFQRNTREHIERLKRTGRPEVLTVNGQAELVVQDAAAYQRLVDELDRSRAASGGRDPR